MAGLAPKAVAVVGAALLVGGGLIAGDQLTPFSSTQVASSTVPPPANLEVVGKTETSITLGWGPTLPGVLHAGAATPRSLVISWGPSQDNHGPVTYTFSKNGKVTATGLTRLFNKVGFTLAVRTFRACVWAVSVQGKSGPPMCATFNGA